MKKINSPVGGIVLYGVVLLMGMALSATGQEKGAALDVKADAYVTGSWNGVLFIVDDAAGFQLRVGTRTEGADFLDGDHTNPFLTGLEDLFDESAKKKRANHPSHTLPHFYESVTKLGPHAPDGSYADLTWNPLFPYDTGSRMRLEWSRVDKTTLLGKLTYVAPLNYMTETRSSDVVLEAYSPIGFKAQYKALDGVVSGQARYVPVLSAVEWNQWKFYFSSEQLETKPDAEPGYGSAFWKADYDDHAWKTVRWGSYWQEDPFVDKKGFAWYRIQVNIPSEMKGKTLRLKLGKVREKDWTYLNGELVGKTDGANEERIYQLRPGAPAYEKIRWNASNSIAVQVFSASDLGGISSGPYDHTPKYEAVRVDPPPRPRIEALAATPKSVNFVLLSNRHADQSTSFKTIVELEEQMQKNWELGATTGDQVAGLLYNGLHAENMKSPRDNELFFCGKVGTESADTLGAQCRTLLDRRDLTDILDAARTKYEAQRVQTQGGLSEAAEMITNTLHWATIYSPEQKRSFVVDSRRWFLPDSWSLFGNSAVLTAWAAALENKTLAEDTLSGILIERLPNGMVMNGAGKVITTPDRSEDMYAAYVAWKIYQKWGDKKFLSQMYPLVKGWHEWWFADRGDGQPWRDGNKDGLLELGSNMSAFDTPQSPPESEQYGIHHQGAMWESGYDDSPMWGYYVNGPSVHPEQYRGDPKVKYIFRTGTLNTDITLTNALFALSADILARIAHELGYSQDEQHFQQQYEQVKKRINEVLWDEKTGMYLNRTWPEEGGEFSYRKSPVMFYMMAAGIPSPEQAHRLVYEHLLNPKEFWGDNVLPSISRDDPAFPEQYYWRGTIWPPMNYFTYEGLTRYGYDDVAAKLAEKTFQLVKRNWDTSGALWENYNSITGEGNSHGAGGSTKHYSWSAALPMLAIMDSIDTDTWREGLRFGSLGATQENRVSGLQIRGVDYGVTAGPNLTQLFRQGQRVFYAPTAIHVNDFLWKPDHVTFQYKSRDGSGEFQCILGGLSLAAGAKPLIRIDSHPLSTGDLSNANLAISLPYGEHSVEITVLQH
jgi:hypothetical protein